MPFKSPEERRRYQREWCQRRRAEWMKDKSCLRCGETAGLEVHHRDPAQKVTHKIWSWSKTRMETELSKCDVLCTPCHRLTHYGPPKDTSTEAWLAKWDLIKAKKRRPRVRVLNVEDVPECP